MGIIHTEKLTGPSVWKGPDFEGDDSWIRPPDEPLPVTR